MQSREAAEALAAENPKRQQEHEAHVVRLKQRLESKRDQVYSLEISFKQADAEGGDYGTVKFRLFKMSDVAWMIVQPIFQRDANKTKVMPDGSVQIDKPLTESEQKELFELHCAMLARVLVHESAMTKAELVGLDDYRFVEIVFATISERSGMGVRAQQDIQDFFQDPGR